MAAEWDAVATLVDGYRRALFGYVQKAGHPVSREEAAESIGISRGLAAFHLDKLVDAGLLRARYEAPADLPRGRGRTPKIYEPVADEVVVCLPERRYELVAQILADAVAEEPTQADVAAREHARRYGHDLGNQLRARDGDLVEALTGAGFQPRAAAQRILLDNCPFHAVVTRQSRLVCGLNQEFLTGLLEGLGARQWHARLAPAPGRCCVEIATGPAGGAGPAG